jgi:aminoglycoside phosphotransferase family enzyme/predicted kinase
MTDPILPPVIQAMLTPEFYPHPVTAPISLIQTHISYILLTGEYAYKVKKPMNFGFLDYSTLEKRQHFCQEELRLNQRGAAGLYLEFFAVVQVGDRLQLSQPDLVTPDQIVVDYGVKMRQFPQDTLLTSLYERGELTEALIADLARAIAQFHARSETNDYIRTFGTIPAIRESIDENYDQTEQYIGGPQTQIQFDETRAYTDRFFATQEALFARRVAQHRIRECHGDLHLRNICFWENQLWLFDCIEFNEPFRFVDVMFDIAYIVMDLAVRDATALSAVFLNTYLEQTGDWEGLFVLPLYVSRQTYVRAKVTSFLLGDPAVPEADKQTASETAAFYYRLAWQYSQPKQGRLILMAGLSGSGKSTTARTLAKQWNAIHIRSDAVRKHLAGIPLHHRGGDELYTPEMTQTTYHRLLELGVQLAQAGYTVILDAKYDRQSLRQEAIAQAQSHQIPLHILHCTAPESVLIQRLQARTNDIADATVDVLAKQTFEGFAPQEQALVTVVDTTQPIDVQLQ